MPELPKPAPTTGRLSQRETPQDSGVAPSGQAVWSLAILENAADGVLTVDEHGLVQWMNAAAEAIFGYESHELIGKNVKLLMPPTDRDRHDDYIASYLRTGEKKIIGIGREVIGVRKNGTQFPMYLSVCESTVNGARIFGGIIRDLTAQKDAEAELRRERDFTRRLLDTAQAIILVLDTRGRIVQFNHHMERVAGRSLEDVRERDWFETFVPQTDRARTRWLFKQAVAGGGARGGVYPILVNGGTIRQIEWFESVLEYGEGRRAGLLCIGLDVTERIEAERERSAYEEKLRSLTEELITSEERERRELAVELHDQIGQILALAKIKLGILREAAPTQLIASVTEVRGLVDQAVRCSRSLTMELGATILHELGLEPALAALADDMRDRHGIECTYTKPPAAVMVPQQTAIVLFRAARELLINVVKHARAEHVSIRADVVDNTLRIRVTDDGAGFTVPREGFHASKDGGFGLFSIQERLARLGGSMLVSSRPGGGTNITLEAPLSRPSDQEPVS